MKLNCLICLVAVICLPATAAVFTVTNTDDSGLGSLRWAIGAANGGDNSIINFNILPAGGVKTIYPLSALPTITTNLLIVGNSQPGYAGTPLIELDGSFVIGVDGLRISTRFCVVIGLAIHSFHCASPFCSVSDIVLENGGNNAIVRCYLGLNALGVSPSHAGGVPLIANRGVYIKNSAYNLIGGAGQRNVISANGTKGAEIFIFGAGSISNVIAANYIGTDPSGSHAAVNNFGNGIVIEHASANLIGGTDAGAGNVISANPTNGIYLTDGADFNLIQQNYVGTDYSGFVAVPNGASGVRIENSSSNVIDGSNVISGNVAHGMLLESSGPGSTRGNRIEHNFIGLGGIVDVYGIALGNHSDGIRLTGSSTEGNVIGDMSGLTKNYIGSNGSHGVETSSPRNIVFGNYILDNMSDGIRATSGGDDNTIQQNLLLDNHDGVWLAGNNNYVTGNSISNNLHNGVTVSVPGTGNTIRQNCITLNDQLGIDLDPEGVTLNDDKDVDGGANHRQNFPVIGHAVHDDTHIQITGSINSDPLTSLKLDFYLNAACDNFPGNSGYGEGCFYIGQTNVLTDPNGDAPFATTFTISSVPGWVVTATATTAFGGDTSEFSACYSAEYGAFLDIHREDAGHISVSWMNANIPWQIQSTPLPISSNIWQDLTNPPAGNNGRFQLIEPIVPEGKLYRLRRSQ